MSSQVLAVFCLFVLRLGIPLMVMLALGVLLGQWDGRRADSPSR